MRNRQNREGGGGKLGVESKMCGKDGRRGCRWNSKGMVAPRLEGGESK